MEKSEINIAKKSKNWWRNSKSVFLLYGVLPSILSIDINAIVDQALRDFDPAVERHHVERRAIVVVLSVHQR